MKEVEHDVRAFDGLVPMQCHLFFAYDSFRRASSEGAGEARG